MSHWPEALAALIEQGKPLILVTIVEAKGSVPRGAGTKMMVTERGIDHGTIGGGNLEHQCMLVAQHRLKGDEVNTSAGWLRKVQRFPLGASLGQCCGGVVVVLLEYIEAVQPDWLDRLLGHKAARVKSQLITSLVTPQEPKQVVMSLPGASTTAPATVDKSSDYLTECVEPIDFTVVVFGAGHVGRALIHVLAGVECEVIWVDSRAAEFPDRIPDNTAKIIEPNPEDVVKTVPAGSYFIVLTHNHQLDQLLCEAILRRNDFNYCGLIGSQSKRAKFEHRFRAKGFSGQQIATLTCPMGIAGLSGKQPGHIAIAVAAELLTLREPPVIL